MRAALLPSGPDPFLLAYWLGHYAKWADAVDSLEVIVCGQNDPELRAYIEDCIAAAPHASVSFWHDITDHGVVIDGLVTNTTADLAVICENDAYVQRPSVIGECFERIESGKVDLIGSPRGYASDELLAQAARLWDSDDWLMGWLMAFSPAFVFARRSDLMAVESEHGYPRFGGVRWPPNTYIPSLQMTSDGATLVGDTFVGASFQLRAMGLRCETLPAYRSEEAREDGPWFHVGSLSAGYGMAFLGSDLFHSAAVEDAQRDPRDWHKRIAWWDHIWRSTGGPEDQRLRYFSALHAFMDEAGLIQDSGIQSQIRGLVTWAER